MSLHLSPFDSPTTSGVLNASPSETQAGQVSVLDLDDRASRGTRGVSRRSFMTGCL